MGLSVMNNNHYCNELCLRQLLSIYIGAEECQVEVDFVTEITVIGNKQFFAAAADAIT